VAQARNYLVASIQTFADAKMDVPLELRNDVVHAVFKAGDLRFMVSSGEGASVGMPLQDTFWGARFGMLCDKYGINWMLNWQKQRM
jgi:uncharacterized glyoxalase superfamily protein PhnB